MGLGTKLYFLCECSDARNLFEQFEHEQKPFRTYLNTILNKHDTDIKIL